MLQKPWVSEFRKNLICVDSYDDGVLKGRAYGPWHDGERFESLSQFLVKMEQILDEAGEPQSYTVPRSFSSLLPESHEELPATTRRGKKATFEMQILFRQHTSWQGVVHWREKGVEQSFRSVLELVILMDSALRGE